MFGFILTFLDECCKPSKSVDFYKEVVVSTIIQYNKVYELIRFKDDYYFDVYEMSGVKNNRESNQRVLSSFYDVFIEQNLNKSKEAIFEEWFKANKRKENEENV